MVSTSAKMGTFDVPDDSSSENEIKDSLDDLNEILRHPNIVDFEHVPTDSPDAAPDGREDPDHAYDPAPDYIPRFGDILSLQEIIWRNKKPPGPPTSKSPAGIPEPRIWHVLLSVLKGLSYLHTGRRLPIAKHTAPNDWNPIVHNAIRPENIIFLHPISRKSTTNLAFRYGRCMVGDFSRSVVLSPPGRFATKNPRHLMELERRKIVKRRKNFEPLYFAGEKTGFEAPEIVAEQDEYVGKYKTEYPGPASDLWSLGATAVTMMTGSTIWDVLLEIEFEEKAANFDEASISEDWRHAQTQRRHRLLRSYTEVQSRVLKALPRLYSPELRVIVGKLLNANPWNRGLAPDILTITETKYDEWREKGFRIFEAEPVERMKDDVFEKQETYRIRDAEKYLKSLGQTAENARRPLTGSSIYSVELRDQTHI